MDLKKYAGKLVHVQLLAPWIVVGAGASGPPNPMGTEDHPPPQSMIFLAGQVDEEGRLLMSMNGGLVAVDLASAAIHSIAVVVEPGAAEKLVQPVVSAGGLILPGAP